MGVFQRISDITKASIHELLDKVEDPIIMLNQYIRDMEEEIAKAEVTVAKQMANERKLKQRLDDAQRIRSDREAKAMDALQNGQEDLAKRILEEKLYYDDQVTELTQMYETSKNHVQQLSEQLHQMKHEFYQMRNKRNELVSRARLAKAKKQMAQVSYTNHIGTGKAAQGFKRVEEKIMEMEAEADIIGKPYTVIPDYSGSLSAEQQFRVEEELVSLKEKLQPVKMENKTE